jgi:osmoprotectant transport system substrate-binding protein
MRGKALLAVLSIGVMTLSGCALGGSEGTPAAAGANASGPLKGVHVAVGSKEFTEQLILCEITAQRLEAQGATVKRVCGMSGSDTVRAAETSGNIDMYWEYTGTGWISFLKQTEPIHDANQQYTKVRDMDLAQNKIVWLPAAAANNTYAVAVKTETAAKLKVKTLSDYAALSQSNPKDASFCGASEFLGRNDGWPGLKSAYGINVPDSEVATLAEGPIYNSISTGNPCNFGEAFATDGRIAGLGLTVLKDDKNFFPFYNLSLTVRQDFSKKNPAVEAAMKPITAKLTNATLQKLNASVDVDGKSPEAVATAFLTDNDLK